MDRGELQTLRPIRNAALLTVLIAIVLALSTVAVPRASGATVADSGFRPNPDGFSFQNYGAELVPGSGVLAQDLGPEQMKALYGRRVCGWIEQGRCRLTPVARMVMKFTNTAMAGGHCYGFSVLSLLLHSGDWPPFGAGPTFGLQVDDVGLQRTIAYMWAQQTVSAVTSRVEKGSPNRILSLLRERLKPDASELWTLAIFQRDGGGGHAITPYAVDDLGGGRYDVLVYDNNWPDEERRVHFDTNENTWNYDAAQKPGDPTARYEGDAKTRSASLYPAKPGLGVNACPFCMSKTKKGGRYNLVTLEGNPRDHAHLVLVDRKGRKSGYVKGRLVNRIPGVKVVRTFSDRLWRDGPEPMYRVPRKTQFHAVIDGRTLKRTDNERLGLTGPGFNTSLDDISISPGERARVSLTPRGNKLTYKRTKGTESPHAQFSLASKNTNLQLELTAVEAALGSKLRFRNVRKGSELRFSDAVHRPQRYLIDVLNLNERKKQAERVAGQVTLRADERAMLHYGKFVGRKGNALRVVIKDSAGNVRRVLIRRVES